MAMKRLYEGQGKPDIVRAVTIFNAIRLPRQRKYSRMRDIHVSHIPPNRFVIDGSHLLFQRESEAEARSFLAGRIATTERLLNIIDLDRREKS